VAFAEPGTDVGVAGVAAAQTVVDRSPASVAGQQQRLQSGRMVTVAAYVAGQPVGVGSHQPVGGVTEIVGMAVLPAHRRQGIAAAITSRLVEDALGRGINAVFLSAGDDNVARVYERVGFRRIATASIAES
jgi:predicted GNAT family acetyltransferase